MEKLGFISQERWRCPVLTHSAFSFLTSEGKRIKPYVHTGRLTSSRHHLGFQIPPSAAAELIFGQCETAPSLGKPQLLQHGSASVSPPHWGHLCPPHTRMCSRWRTSPPRPDNSERCFAPRRLLLHKTQSLKLTS